MALVLTELLQPWWQHWHVRLAHLLRPEHLALDLQDRYVGPIAFAGGGVIPGFTRDAGVQRAFSVITLHAGALPWLRGAWQPAFGGAVETLAQRARTWLRNADLHLVSITAQDRVEAPALAEALALDDFLQLAGHGRPPAGPALALLRRTTSGAPQPVLILPLSVERCAVVAEVEVAAPWRGLPKAHADAFRRWMLLRAAAEPLGVPLSDVAREVTSSAAATSSYVMGPSSSGVSSEVASSLHVMGPSPAGVSSVGSTWLSAETSQRVLDASANALTPWERRAVHEVLSHPLFDGDGSTRAQVLLARLVTPARRDLLREMLGLLLIPAQPERRLAHQLRGVPAPGHRAWWVWANPRLPLLVDFAEATLRRCLVELGHASLSETPDLSTRRALARGLRSWVADAWGVRGDEQRYALALSLLACWCEEAFEGPFQGFAPKSREAKALARVAHAHGIEREDLCPADLPRSYRDLLALRGVGTQSAQTLLATLETWVRKVLDGKVAVVASARSVASVRSEASREISATLAALEGLLEEEDP